MLQLYGRNWAARRGYISETGIDSARGVCVLSDSEHGCTLSSRGRYAFTASREDRNGSVVQKAPGRRLRVGVTLRPGGLLPVAGGRGTITRKTGLTELLPVSDYLYQQTQLLLQREVLIYHIYLSGGFRPMCKIR